MRVILTVDCEGSVRPGETLETEEKFERLVFEALEENGWSPAEVSAELIR